MAGTRERLLGLLLVSLTPLRGLAKAASTVEPPDPTIIVRVYDYAAVPKTTWARATRRASEIFRKAGVETTWVRRMGLRTEVIQEEHNADLASAPGLKLRILPQFVAARPEFTKVTTGYALVNAEVGRAAYAAVFYDRVVHMAQEISYPGEGEEILGEVLAHVVAHELGHLLLGSNSHSKTGLMRARWSCQDLCPVEAARLHFTPEQAEIIHSEALAWSKAGQNPVGAAATLVARPSLAFLPVNTSWLR